MAEDYPKIDKITRWFVFIPMAWWIAQYKNAIWLIWGCAALGILVSPWVTGEGIPEIIRGLNGERVFFGLRQAQHTSLFFGVILIGLLCFTRKNHKHKKVANHSSLTNHCILSFNNLHKLVSPSLACSSSDCIFYGKLFHH